MGQSTVKNPFFFWIDFFDNEIHRKRRELGTNDIAYHFHQYFPYMVKKGMAKITDDYTIIYQQTYKDLNLPREAIPARDVVYSFERFLKDELKEEILRSKELISDGFFESASEGKSPNEYRKQLLRVLSFLENHTNNKFKFTRWLIQDFKRAINIYSESKSDNPDVFSFQFLANGKNASIDQILSFYDKCVESPAIIEAKQEEFIKAFSGEAISDGLNWLISGKNGKTSKSAIFYFITELESKGFVDKKAYSDLNRYVKYVFRDKHGNTLENIRQSKMSSTSNPAGKDRIDSIIQSL